MTILGIDPGIGRTGWGIVLEQGSRFKPLGYGCFETEPNSELPQRLVLLEKEIERLVKEYKPEIVGIEELFFNSNAKTAMMVGQARGVVIATVAGHGIPLLSLTPLEIKTAITGYGRAEKDQVGKMVKTLLNLASVPKPDDTADALACALAASFSRKIKGL